MHGAAIRFWNYAFYCGAIAAAALTLLDLPCESQSSRARHVRLGLACRRSGGGADDLHQQGVVSKCSELFESLRARPGHRPLPPAQGERNTASRCRPMVGSAGQRIGLATARLVMEPSLRLAPVCLAVSLAWSGHRTS